ncbi:MAG TPA: protein kinase, partial [Thermoanaerobaculia bacterium]|nr:protein kinase [Thermoanaerobaculia bacterium]
AAGLTRIGASLGTPGYMSPEQARGEEVDHRTDVWSLGAVLYEMVTGRRPFRGDHDQAVLYALFNQEPDPVEQLRPDAPPELVRIIGRMLTKDPDRRYLTAAEALADLRALYGPVTGTGTRTGTTGGLTGTTSVPALAAPKAAPRRRWFGAALIAAVALGACLAAYLLLRPGQKVVSPLRMRWDRLTNLAGRETFPSLAPDGSFFVYTKSEGGRSHIFLQRVGGANYRDLSNDPTADDTQPAYSPDGDHIAFRSTREGGGIFVMGATGESPRRLTDRGYNPAWSPESKEIVFATDGVAGPANRHTTMSQIWRVPVGGGEQRLVWRGDGVQPSWSPHGSRIAYWGVEQGSRRTIWTVPVTGGNPTRVTDDEHLNWNPVWSPDGRFLYFASNRGGSMNFWRVPIDEASGKVLGDPEPLGTPAQWCGFLSFSRDGRRFVYANDDSRSNIERIEVDLSTDRVLAPATAVTEGSQTVVTFDTSPDGKWIVFSTAAPREDLFMIRPDGTGLRQLTTGGSKNRIPHWSPDGTLIAFYSDRGGDYQGWTIRPDGSDLKLISDAKPLYNPIWSADGRQLACLVGAHQDLAMIDFTRPLAQRRPMVLPLRAHPLTPFSWSSDGQELVGLSEGNVFVYSIPGGGYERITRDKAQCASWLHDDRNVLYLSDGKVMVADTRSRSSRQLFTPPANSELNWVCASPDDRMIYIARAVQEGDVWLGTLP